MQRGDLSGPKCTCKTSEFTNLGIMDNCINPYEIVRLRYTTQYKKIGKPLIFISIDVKL